MGLGQSAVNITDPTVLYLTFGGILQHMPSLALISFQLPVSLSSVRPGLYVIKSLISCHVSHFELLLKLILYP